MAIYALWFIRGPVHNAFDASSIHYEGMWEGVGPWKSRLFWALWNSKSKNKYGKRDIAMAHGCCVCWRGPKNLSSSTVQKEWKIHRKQGYKEGVSSVQIKVQFSPDCRNVQWYTFFHPLLTACNSNHGSYVDRILCMSKADTRRHSTKSCQSYSLYQRVEIDLQRTRVCRRSLPSSPFSRQ